MHCADPAIKGVAFGVTFQNNLRFSEADTAIKNHNIHIHFLCRKSLIYLDLFGKSLIQLNKSYAD